MFAKSLKVVQEKLKKSNKDSLVAEAYNKVLNKIMDNVLHDVTKESHCLYLEDMFTIDQNNFLMDTYVNAWKEVQVKLEKEGFEIVDFSQHDSEDFSVTIEIKD